jgi:hypothetical protein
MDPDATWRMLCATLGELGDHADDQELRDQAIKLLDALASWLQRGGFPPTAALDKDGGL